jgi:hypothetical protein
MQAACQSVEHLERFQHLMDFKCILKPIRASRSGVVHFAGASQLRHRGRKKQQWTFKYAVWERTFYVRKDVVCEI